MTKAEKIGILIGFISLVVSFAAWQFPVGESSSQSQFILTYTPGLPEEIFEVNKSELGSENNRASRNEPLVKEISFQSLMIQMKSFPLDSSRLDFARKAKKLLDRELEFNEFSALIAEIQLDSNKIEMMSIFLDKVKKPTEKEIEELGSQFLLPSNRQEALSLLYK